MVEVFHIDHTMLRMAYDTMRSLHNYVFVLVLSKHSYSKHPYDY